MALRHGDDGMCERCRRVVPIRQLSGEGVCGACAAPDRASPEMAMAASLDMEAIVREVVEAGLMDRLRRKKRLPVDPLEAIQQAGDTFIDTLTGVGERATDQSVQDVAEAGQALPRELRKRFPKRR